MANPHITPTNGAWETEKISPMQILSKPKRNRSLDERKLKYGFVWYALHEFLKNTMLCHVAGASIYRDLNLLARNAFVNLRSFLLHHLNNAKIFSNS